ncbi:MAG: preprotein translocase subunit SecE [Bacilli bacterium]|nr:preprotein translocase subunit SecE [Bacilli bacterium]
MKKDTSKKSKKVKAKKPKKGIFKYFHEVRVEVSKVKWPSKKDMVKYSVATLVFILFFAAFFYLIDLIFALLKTGV